jgi:1-acyl-sn-glycerol-3-phosphate acyltransferase
MCLSMKTLLGYLLTPLYHIWFGSVLLFFHPVQVAAFHLSGDATRKKVVDILNCLLVKGLYILGCSIKFSGFEKIPENRPLIIVANHQSLYDIPPVVYGFRKYYPKFISKIELSRNLPSISYNLRHGKSALIDREHGSQAVKEIFKLGKLIEENNYAACIFPEGTRSKSGKVKSFMTAGISTLLRAAPSAVIIPFVIDGHSQLTRKGMFPLQFGQRIRYTVLDPLEPANRSVDEMAVQIKRSIEEKLRTD